jgi:ribosomal protein L36
MGNPKIYIIFYREAIAMFYIEKATHSHVLITSDNNRECAFPIDIFEKSKKRKPKDVKRNRKIAIINGTQHTFKQKEWKDAVQLTEYQIIRDDFEAEVDGYSKTCVILSSENDFLIMPVDDLKIAKVEE